MPITKSYDFYFQFGFLRPGHPAVSTCLPTRPGPPYMQIVTSKTACGVSDRGRGAGQPGEGAAGGVTALGCSPCRAGASLSLEWWVRGELRAGVQVRSLPSQGLCTLSHTAWAVCFQSSFLLPPSLALQGLLHLSVMDFLSPSLFSRRTAESQATTPPGPSPAVPSSARPPHHGSEYNFAF